MTLRESYKELEQNFRAFTNERYCVFGFQGFYVVMFYLCATWKTKEHKQGSGHLRNKIPTSKQKCRQNAALKQHARKKSLGQKVRAYNKHLLSKAHLSKQRYNSRTSILEDELVLVTLV